MLGDDFLSKLRKTACREAGLPSGFADRLRGENYGDLLADAQRLAAAVLPLGDIERFSAEQIRQHAPVLLRRLSQERQEAPAPASEMPEQKETGPDLDDLTAAAVRKLRQDGKI